MKLYTEEQVKEMFEQFQTHLPFHYDLLLQQHLNQLKTIELPSDEEIKKMMESDGMEFDEFDPYDVSYLGGATWMRNKIQGNKE
jgi:hypothetical protein